jgi:hypothetical protein
MTLAEMDWFIVALFGGLVGAGELVSRYRDAPARSVWNWPAIFYILLNTGASVAALALIRVFGWDFGAAGEEPVRWTQVMVAGFGSIVFFRSALFTVRLGDQDVGVGPVRFLQVFLVASDRGVDRTRAQSRSTRVSQMMGEVDYQKAAAALPTYCLALMQNLPPEEQHALAEALTTLDEADVADSVKARLLGLELMNVVGEEVLEDAVKSLGAEIQRS